MRPATIPEAIAAASDETLSFIAEVWALDVPHDATRSELEGAIARWAGDAWVRGHASGEELIEMLGGAPEHALPELFSEALTLVLERRGKLERPDDGGQASHVPAGTPPAVPTVEAGRWYLCRCCQEVVKASVPHATIGGVWHCHNPRTKVDGLYEAVDLELAPEALVALLVADVVAGRVVLPDEDPRRRLDADR